MLKCAIEEMPDADVLRVQGEITGANALLLVEHLARAATHNRPAVLDLSGVVAFHPAAIRSLRTCQEIYRGHDQALVVAALSPAARQAFEAERLGEAMPVLGTREEALAFVRARRPGVT